MKTKITAVLLSGLLLAGCSAPAEEPAPSSPEAASATSEPPAVDRTAEVQKVAGDHVLKAEETDPGRIVVETDLVDPRGEDGSPAAQQAIAVCEAVVQLGDVEHVSLMEKDGTSWILYGHPAVPKGECGEV